MKIMYLLSNPLRVLLTTGTSNKCQTSLATVTVVRISLTSINCLALSWAISTRWSRFVRCRSLRDEGCVVWQTNVGADRPIFSSPCFESVACSGCQRVCPLVYACDVAGHVVALRAEDGLKVGRLRLPGQLFSSPVAMGGVIVVGCRDNNAYAVDVTATCAACKEQEMLTIVKP